MEQRLWVPLTHWLWAQNWNRAAPGACFTASRVANSLAVSTPLRIESWTSAAVEVSVVVISARLLGGELTDRRPAPPLRRWVRGRSRRKRARYISSPIGLGHAQRDVAIASALRLAEHAAA
jgi:hypothetical protein